MGIAGESRSSKNCHTPASGAGLRPGPCTVSYSQRRHPGDPHSGTKKEPDPSNVARIRHLLRAAQRGWRWHYYRPNRRAAKLHRADSPLPPSRGGVKRIRSDPCGKYRYPDDGGYAEGCVNMTSSLRRMVASRPATLSTSHSLPKINGWPTCVIRRVSSFAHCATLAAGILSSE